MDFEAATAIRLFFTVGAAIMGVMDFPAEPANFYHAVIAFICAILSVLLPALVLGIVLVRIFTVRIFKWRATISLIRGSEVDDETHRLIKNDRQMIIAVRWYKIPRQLVISNLLAEAFLNYRTVSRVDGSVVHRTERLRVLGPPDQPTYGRTFPRVWTGMPLTLWIPVDAEMDAGRLVEIQGRGLRGVSSPGLLVRLTGKTVGFTTDIIDEKWYSTEHDVQLGRFAPVHPAVESRKDVIAANWRGWEHFGEPARYAVFGYGSLAHPNTIRQLCGAVERDKNFFIAELSDWRRSWTVCTDNTDRSRSVAYFEPDSDNRIDGQILFLNLVREKASSVRGVVLLVQSDALAYLDDREGNYDRVDVTSSVDLSGVADELKPDVVWAYVGKESAVRQANRGIVRRSAVIWRPYLDRLSDAFAQHDNLLETFQREPLPPDVRVVDLDRRKRDQPADPYADAPR
ncbi:hypothetical protein Air01nite_44510 [Asanoa iriomotensis]|uniref:Uncharacterized protein n=2 Tax=Asanoa iriomotensis TaxID=234613 RepID=A0ABQ4C6F3_9ACTN|nr:hypothetical protein Air01nite_44510 [Asanoa iriomotensis]